MKSDCLHSYRLVTGWRFSVALVGLCFGLMSAAAPVQAQPRQQSRTATGKAPLTTISVELLTGKEGIGVRAQQWLKIFETLDCDFSVRSATVSDKVQVTERTQSGLREVRVVGRLDPQGRLQFAGRQFTDGETDKLKKWLGELKQYGAQGDPAGQPLWGLTKPQFEQLFAALGTPVKESLQGLKLDEALAQIGLPKEFPLQLSDKAKLALKEPTRGDKLVRESLEGVSVGTAFASLLREYGLGFQPRRGTTGTVELVMVDLAEPGQCWPVGWPLPNPGPVMAPKMYSYTTVDLQDIELDGVLDALGDAIGVPILIDTLGIAANKIDLPKLKVTHPAKRTTWSIALKDLIVPLKMRPDLMIDEAGKPFLWVTVLSTPEREPVPRVRSAPESKTKSRPKPRP